jgi:WD repeat-containing protein 26
MCCSIQANKCLIAFQLRNFANASRQLGSSARILSSAYRLRERLAHILHLYQENAADLFPRKIQRTETTASKTPATQMGTKPPKRRPSLNPGTPATGKRGFLSAHVAKPVVPEDLDLEHFPQQFEALAKDIITFVNCLNEFPEFSDENVNASIMEFEGDLQVRRYLFVLLPWADTFV